MKKAKKREKQSQKTRYIQFRRNTMKNIRELMEESTNNPDRHFGYEILDIKNLEKCKCGGTPIAFIEYDKAGYNHKHFTILCEKCLNKCTKIYDSEKNKHIRYCSKQDAIDIVIGQWNRKEYYCYRDDRLKVGDIVQHFKRKTLEQPGQLYLYKILAIAQHTETKEPLVIYQALYESDDMGVHYDIYARPYNMFMSEVDHDKYPDIMQKFRFEIYKDMSDVKFLGE